MKKLFALALVLAAFTPVAAAQTRTAGSFTGKWEGTFTREGADGAAARPIVFDLTQTGKQLTGTAGPPEQQTKIDKAAITAGKATFDVPLPSGQVFKFALSIVKGHLQGDMTGEKDGAVTGRAKVDATKAGAAKAK